MIEKKYAIGLDIGGTFIKSAITDRSGEMIYFAEHETPHTRPQQFVNMLGYIAELMIKESEIDKDQIAGTGVGFPGLVNPESGIVSFAPNLPKWQEYNVRKALEKWLKMPVFVNNDANAATIAEYLWGQASEFDNIVCLTLGTGIGGGIIIDGGLFTGAMHSGAELGHIIIDMNGPKCSCGKYGCLEAFAAKKGFISEAKKQRAKYKGSLLWTENNGKITPESIEKAAGAGDRAANIAISNIARYLAIGLVSICEILNPEIIVIGGGLSRFGELLEKPLNGHFKRIKMIAPRPYIRFSNLDNQAGVMGACASVFQSQMV